MIVGGGKFSWMVDEGLPAEWQNEWWWLVCVWCVVDGNSNHRETFVVEIFGKK